MFGADKITVSHQGYFVTVHLYDSVQYEMSRGDFCQDGIAYAKLLGCIQYDFVTQMFQEWTHAPSFDQDGGAVSFADGITDGS
jgi:hypothetical protein